LGGAVLSGTELEGALLRFLFLFLGVFCVHLSGLSTKLQAADFIEVVDARGQIVSVPSPAKRIVTLSFASLELIRLMGSIDRVVGAAQYVKARRDLAPETVSIVNVGRGFMPNLEVLARLQPDLVITRKSSSGLDLERQLEPLGVKVLRLDFFLPEVFEREVRVLAKVLGGEASMRAERYLAWNREHEQRLKSLLQEADLTPPTILVEHFTQRRLAGPGSGAYFLTTMLGADNFAKILGRASSIVDAEWVVKKNPDYFIKMVSLVETGDEKANNKQLAQARQEVLHRQGWQDMNAVRQGRVYVLDLDIGGGPRYVIGLYLLAHWLYPKAVPEDSAANAYDEYLHVFHGF
jgi:iron complex transport system substrate-binding protein